MRRIALAIAAALIAGCLHSTRPAPAPHSWDLVGTVRDKAGSPIHARVFVCVGIRGASGGRRCSGLDSLGNYAIDSTVPYKLSVAVECDLIGFPFRKSLIGDTTDAGPPVAIRRDWNVDPTGCDPRPLRTIHGVFRGHWIPGFESSDFTPCPQDAWYVSGDSLDRRGHLSGSAWASAPPSLWKKVSFPRTPLDSDGYPHYYVRWRATITGPGVYGHLGGSGFDLQVERLIEIRAESPDDCR